MADIAQLNRTDIEREKELQIIRRSVIIWEMSALSRMERFM